CINGEREVCGGCFSTASECACAGDNYTPLIQKCSTCRGTGILQRDPAQHLVVPPEVLEKNSDLVRIVNPDTDINKYHQENNLALYEQLFEASYLRYVDQAQSGKAKELDLEGRLNFYTAVSNDLFDRLIPSVLETILALRDIQVINGVKVPKVGEYTILKPVTFLMQSAEELLSEYDAAVKAGVPTYLTSALLGRYIEKQFVNDALLRKKAKVINSLDDLATRPDDKIQMMGMTGFIPIERVKMHYQLPTMVEDLIRDRGKQWFVEASTDAIREALNFDERLEEMKTITTPNYDIEGG